MPNVTMTFSLPDEEEDFGAAFEGPAAREALREIARRCREVVKYEMDPSEDRVALAEEIRKMVFEADGVTLT
jgi:hypothetical protein